MELSKKNFTYPEGFLEANTKIKCYPFPKFNVFVLKI